MEYLQPIKPDYESMSNYKLQNLLTWEQRKSFYYYVSRMHQEIWVPTTLTKTFSNPDSKKVDEFVTNIQNIDKNTKVRMDTAVKDNELWYIVNVTYVDTIRDDTAIRMNDENDRQILLSLLKGELAPIHW